MISIELQARKEQEARAAEGGWTVVVHHKGRKKTTEAETGVTVGSVAQAAVMDKMAKKKAQEPVSNFYRFQRREAQRNGEFLFKVICLLNLLWWINQHVPFYLSLHPSPCMIYY